MLYHNQVESEHILGAETQSIERSQFLTRVKEETLSILSRISSISTSILLV